MVKVRVVGEAFGCLQCRLTVDLCRAVVGFGLFVSSRLIKLSLLKKIADGADNATHT